MRGLRLWPLFAPTRRGRGDFPGVPSYLYAYPLGVSLMPAGEYDARNDRYIPEIFQAQPVEATVPVATKGAYSHVAKIQAGGWGHVPETPPATVERRQNIERLRREVKQQC